MKNQKKKQQLARVYEALKDRQPKTTLQLAFETQVLRSNVCRYVSKLEQQGLAVVAYEGKCSISKHKAKHYSAHPAWKSEQRQGKLFDNKELTRNGVFV